jgi:hypothetical protein
MRTLVLLVSLMSAVSVSAKQFIFEPYVDAKYACNWIEGLNSQLLVEANSVDEAVALVSPSVGQTLVVGCNRDVYQCVHKDGDVEPRPISRLTEEKSLLVISGRLVDAETKQEVAQIGSATYHRNLKRIPKCNW